MTETTIVAKKITEALLNLTSQADVKEKGFFLIKVAFAVEVATEIPIT